MHYDLAGETPIGRLLRRVETPWRLAVRKMLPNALAWRYRRLKYYLIKTRCGTQALRNIVLD